MTDVNADGFVSYEDDFPRRLATVAPEAADHELFCWLSLFPVCFDDMVYEWLMELYQKALQDATLEKERAQRFKVKLCLPFERKAKREARRARLLKPYSLYVILQASYMRDYLVFHRVEL